MREKYITSYLCTKKTKGSADIKREKDDGVENTTGREPELGDFGLDLQKKARRGK